jgi:hypothetical protein
VAITILNNTRIFTGGTDLTSRANKVEIAAEVEDKDATTFADVDASGNVWKVLRGGLQSAKIDASGFWESDGVGAVDDVEWAQFGGLGVWTVFPIKASVVGDVCYFGIMDNASYHVLGGAPGDIAPWQANASSNTPMARGKLLTLPGTALTTTGTGTILDFGTTWPAGLSMWASMHVLSVSGTTPSITARIETAPTVGFASPTTRLTFAAATARGAQTQSTAANISDQFVRAAWTISGTTPSFLAVISVGIADT